MAFSTSRYYGKVALYAACLRVLCRRRSRRRRCRLSNLLGEEELLAVEHDGEADEVYNYEWALNPTEVTKLLTATGRVP